MAVPEETVPQLDGKTLHERAIVFDALDVSRLSDRHIERLLAAGVTAVNHTVTLGDGLGFAQTVDRLAQVRSFIELRENRAMVVKTPADIHQAKVTGRVGIVLGLQNTTAIEGDLNYLQVLYDLGIRVIQLTYHTANLVADGCLEPRNAGLTRFGRAVIREMNTLGILTDLSHVGDRSALEAIECSALPPAVTHANCRSLHRNPRNKDDTLLRALADAGGVIGLTPLPDFLVRDPASATIDDYLRHVDYAVDVVGIDHVGIGCDFTTDQTLASLVQVSFSKWGGSYPEGGIDGLLVAMRSTDQVGATLTGQPYAEGLPDHSGLINVTKGLQERGFADGDIYKILGGNFIRLLTEVQGAAKTPQSKSEPAALGHES